MFDKRLLKLIPEARKYLVLAVAGNWAALICYAVAMLALASFLSALALGGLDAAAVGQWAAVSAAAMMLRFAFVSVSQYAGSKASAVGKAAVRERVYDKLVALGSSYKEQVSTTQAVQICGEGAEKLEVYLGQYLPQLFYAVLAPLTLFVLFLFIDVPAAVVLLVCVPLIPIAIVAIMKVARRVMGAYWDSYSDLGQTFYESISALTTLKLFQADEAKQRQMDEEAEGFRASTMRLLRMQLNSITVMDFFTFGGAAVGIVIALFQLAAGEISLAAAVSVALLAVEFFLPMRILGSYFHTAMGAAPVLDQMFSLLQLPDLSQGAETVEAGEVEIVCEGLSYSYGEGSALTDINLKVEENTFVGITGESGSGKSTLAKLLSGELMGYTGSVRFNGVELRNISPDSLHGLVTHISASAYIFKGTIRTNLLVGNRNATDYALWSALGKCNLDDFVLKQGGLDIPVAEGGANLSGGQRQRLAIARALLRDTPIYLFDESTSNVDADSERDILACIQRLSIEKTVIVISHRLSALAWADNIVVMEKGRIVEQGAHGQLAAAGGAYAKLWQQQEQMEALARQAEEVRAMHSKADGEADVDVPGVMAEALEKMPPSIATATRSCMKGAKIRALVEEGGSGMPAGHPADILIDAADSSQEGMAPAASAEGAQAEGTDGSNQAAAAVAPKKKRSVPRVVWGLLGLFGRLWPLVGTSTLFASFGFAAAISMVVLGAAAMLGIAADCFTWNIALVAALVLLCGVVRGFLRYGERLVSHDQTFQTLAVIRSKVFRHMRTLAPARLEARDTGDLITLLTADIELLEVFYAHTISPVLVALIVSAAVAVGIGTQQVWLGLAAAAGFAVVGVLLPILLNIWTDTLGRRTKERSVRFGSFMYESLMGLSEVLRFGATDLRRDELGGRMGALAAEEVKMARRSAVAQGLTDTLTLASCFLFAYLAYALTAQGQVVGAAAAVCVVAYSVSFDPVRAVAHLGSSLHQTLASGERVLDFLDERPETLDVEQGAEPAAFTGAKLQDVTFAYGEEEVLSNFNVSIEPGAFLHVAGPSGAGKSTFLKLLMRVWDAQQGSVTVSGEEVRHIKTTCLRTLEGSMTQTTHLFSGTIRQNIAFVRPGCTEEELNRAVEQASLASLIERLPKGLDTQLGEIGEGLSAGERQRIGLARIFLYDAPFLLLDEPTSNLDCLNEVAVLNALAQSREGKTIAMVSHRMSAAAFADTTLVVDQGRLS